MSLFVVEASGSAPPRRPLRSLPADLFTEPF